MDQDSSGRFADVAASSTNWSKEPDCRPPPSANLPRSWRGSTNSRRRSWSRLSLPLRSLTLRRDWISWRGRDSSRLHLLLPSLFCWPSRDNRRPRRERGLPREGKLKVVRIGIHGSKKQACGEALSCSSAVARSQTSLPTELLATAAPTMPNVVESMLDYAFCASPMLPRL